MNVIARSIKNNQVEITAGSYRWAADEPEDESDVAGPSPCDILLGALGACKVIMVQMYARKKGWPVEGVQVVVSRSKAKGCESNPNGTIDILECEFDIQGELTSDQIQRLLQIAEHCPVHQTITGATQIHSHLAISGPERAGV